LRKRRRLRARLCSRSLSSLSLDSGGTLTNKRTDPVRQAQIIAGGNLDASTVGVFQNYWSAVAAVGNIAAPVSLDQNSWQGQTAPQVQVTYSGYYHYNNYDNSEHNWTLPFGNPFSQSPLALILQGIANGLNAVFGMPGGEPPTTGAQGVLVRARDRRR
jgi:hypothetical protein